MGKDKNGNGGVVVNIGSAASVRPQISTPVYTATKHAVLGLSRSCGVRQHYGILRRGIRKSICVFILYIQDAYHFNLTGVRVIALCPGALDTGSNSVKANGNRFKSPMHERAWQLDMKGVVPQKYELSHK